MFPQEFLNRLEIILPAEGRSDFFSSSNGCAYKTARINTLKMNTEEVTRIFEAAGISFKKVEWCKEAVIISEEDRSHEMVNKLILDGALYWQSLSSMLVVKILGPEPGETVLDMCAAPGSKTTQIAALMNNSGEITAVDIVRNRFYKLRSVCELLGADIVKPVLKDGRRFRSYDLYDKILIDAPCSAEARFRVDDPDTYKYWSLRKIKEMSFKQKGLLLNAGRLLKPGGTMVYSTCTFSPEENEEVIDWFLRKTGNDFSIVPVDISVVSTLPPLVKWGKKVFLSEVSNSVRLLPSGLIEGFFITKLSKNR
jgi:16S rRNA (cytosine1407-C5)-methyltransferase